MISDFYKTVSDALVSEGLYLAYANEISPRGMKTKEAMNNAFIIENPLQRHLLVDKRYASPFATIAETLWTLAGRNDLDWLERYIPQCKKWSDDGKTWRAAYGPRLRKWNDGAYGSSDIDQIDYVISKLKEDPYSRQAVISLWNPSWDTEPGSKDYSCNNWLQFLIRDGKLHLSVVLRSNDLIYGFSHNDFFLWSVLQELVANCVGVQVGSMTWFAGSFHVYERHFELLKTMEVVEVPENMKLIPMDVNSLEEFDKHLHLFIDLEKNIRDDLNYEAIEGDFQLLSKFSTWFATMYLMMVAYDMKLSGKCTNVDISVMLETHVGNTDLFYSTMLYLFKENYYEVMKPYIVNLAD